MEITPGSGCYYIACILDFPAVQQPLELCRGSGNDVPGIRMYCGNLFKYANDPVFPSGNGVSGAAQLLCFFWNIPVWADFGLPLQLPGIPGGKKSGAGRRVYAQRADCGRWGRRERFD